MKITQTEKNSFCIIYPEGRVDSTKVSEFGSQILDLAEHVDKNLIINCRDLTYINSLGLRIFLTAQKKIIKKKGKLILCELAQPVLETFAISGFPSIFKIYETEEEALED
jgi:anti-sigma B factor antagonist